MESKVVLVTGGANGLGQTIAVMLAESGADIALVDLDAAGMAATAKKVRELGRSCCAIEANLTRPEDVTGAIECTVQELGKLDVLVNNAGTASVQPLLQITAEEWDKVFAVNVRGLFLMLQAAARCMKEQGGGRIVNITSPASRMAMPNYAAYAASKAAVDSITRSAAVTLAPYGILVNSVAPGMMDTEMQRATEKLFAVAENRSDFEVFLQERTRRIPFGRRAQIEEVAAAVVWLSLHAPSYIVAERLNISGGLDKD